MGTGFASIEMDSTCVIRLVLLIPIERKKPAERLFRVRDQMVGALVITFQR